jgi:hypothetical protein
MSSNSAQVDALPCDFSHFVALRRQLSDEAASDLIGEWLATYEPGPIAQSHVEGCATTKRPVRASRSAAAGRTRKAA